MRTHLLPGVLLSCWMAAAAPGAADTGLRFDLRHTHDYIVPLSNVNIIGYVLPTAMASVAIEVRDRRNRLVRTLRGWTGAGAHHVYWNGHDAQGKALTEAGSPYTYVLKARTRVGKVLTAKLGERLLRSRSMTFTVCDGSVPPADWESGVNEETIADPQGKPRNLHVRVRATGGDWYEITCFGVTPDAGEKGWDADVRLLDGDKQPFLFYTTPEPSVWPAVRYEMVVWETPPFVQDNTANEWDLYDLTEQQETMAIWTFTISPHGKTTDFTESYR